MNQREKKEKAVVNETLTIKSNMLSDSNKAIIETIRMRLSTEQALQYLVDNGYSLSRAHTLDIKRKLNQ